jgi:O-antigen ligase
MVMMPVLFRFFVDALPHFPGSPLPIISIMKPGDRGVILAGCAAFMLCGLYARASGPRKMPPLVFWLCWFAAALLVAALNRGGLVAMTSALALLMLVQPSREWLKPVVIGGVVIAALLVVNPTIDVGKARPLSVTQLTANITSIFSDEESNTGSVQGTKEWRLNWWTDIYNDTVHGPSFWTGKGFGLNIADEYGYQTDEVAGTLRSPHNMHMTVLARMGVPGTVLWFVLQLTFAIQMILSLYRARSFKDGYAVQLHSWILAMWVAGLVNSTFDVYLEGPQGAIPFWCAFGAGLALLKFERQKREATAMQPYDAGRGTLYAHPARP